jgi:hypothetical protein
MSRDRNTYAKRQRETKKRQKAEDKRAKRLKRKDEPETVGPAAESDELLAADEPLAANERLAEVQ